MIGMAKQVSGVVHVYDERGQYQFSHAGDLQGYTTTTVSIKVGKVVHTYDEHGAYKFSH